MNYFDRHGWLSASGSESRIGSDDIPSHDNSAVVGQYWPNWNGHSWVLTTYFFPSSPEIPLLGTKIRPIAFLNRFGGALVGLYTAAMTNPQVQIYRDKVLLTPNVDLANPATIADINQLAAAGLISADLAHAILTSPVTQDELP